MNLSFLGKWETLFCPSATHPVCFNVSFLTVCFLSLFASFVTDTLADLASREQDSESGAISSSTSSTSGGSTTSESVGETASSVSSYQTQAEGGAQGPAPKRLRAYSESFVRDQEESRFDWEATKQRLLLLSANSVLYNEQESKPPMPPPSQHQPHQVSGRTRSDSEIEEDQRDYGLGNNVATTSMLEQYDQMYNKGGRIGVYTREERVNIIRRFHEKRKTRVWKKKIRYHCRKNLADRRLRVKGRFIKAGSEAYFALQAQGVIDESGELVLPPIDEDEDGDEDGDEEDGLPDSAKAAAAAKRKEQQKQQQQKEAAQKEKLRKQEAHRQKQAVALAKKQQQQQQSARVRSGSGSGKAMDVDVPPSSPPTAENVAIFDDMVRSPKSENAARNSLSLLLSMADGDCSASSSAPGTGTGADADAGVAGTAPLPPFLLEAAAAGVNTGTGTGTGTGTVSVTSSGSASTVVGASGPTAGLYLLGRAISTDNLERAGGNHRGLTLSPGVRPSGTAATTAGGAVAVTVPTDSEMIDLLLSSKRMRRHSIAY